MTAVLLVLAVLMVLGPAIVCGGSLVRLPARRLPRIHGRVGEVIVRFVADTSRYEAAIRRVGEAARAAGATMFEAAAHVAEVAKATGVTADEFMRPPTKENP